MRKVEKSACISCLRVKFHLNDCDGQNKREPQRQCTNVLQSIRLRDCPKHIKHSHGPKVEEEEAGTMASLAIQTTRPSAEMPASSQSCDSLPTASSKYHSIPTNRYGQVATFYMDADRS